MSEALPVVGRGFCFEDLRLGFRFRTHRRTIVEADLAAFANLTWLTEELFTSSSAPRRRRERPRGGATGRLARRFTGQKSRQHSWIPAPPSGEPSPSPALP